MITVAQYRQCVCHTLTDNQQWHLYRVRYQLQQVTVTNPASCHILQKVTAYRVCDKVTCERPASVDNVRDIGVTADCQLKCDKRIAGIAHPEIEISPARPTLVMGAHRHGQGGISPPPSGNVVKFFCALVVTIKRSVDEIFMH